MNPYDFGPGKMDRKSGAARCGGCHGVWDAVTGGRRAQKHGGWVHTLELGWICPGCSTWAVVDNSGPVVENSEPISVQVERGWGLSKVGVFLGAEPIPKHVIRKRLRRRAYRQRRRARREIERTTTGARAAD